MFDLTNILLQTSQNAQASKDSGIELASLIVSAATALALLGALIFNWFQVKADRDERNTSLLKQFQKDLFELVDRERNIKSQTDCLYQAIGYLDILSSIVFLSRKGQFPVELVAFFNDNFSYGLSIMEWYGKYLEDPGRGEKIWYDVKEWCDDHKISKPPYEWLPDAMVNYEKLPP